MTEGSAKIPSSDADHIKLTNNEPNRKQISGGVTLAYLG